MKEIRLIKSIAIALVTISLANRLAPVIGIIEEDSELENHPMLIGKVLGEEDGC